MMKLGFFLCRHRAPHRVLARSDVAADANAKPAPSTSTSRQPAERALFDFVFNADSNSTFGPDDPDIWKRNTVAMRHRAADLARRAVGGHEPHRSDLDGDHHLSRSVPCGADVRHARPDERGPRRLERGDLVGGVGSLQLQPRQARRARRPLPPRRGVHPGGAGPLGHLGGRRLRAWTRRRACSSTRPSCTCCITRASISRCAGR